MPIMLYLSFLFFPLLAGTLVKALEADWQVFSEAIGLWIPTEVVHTEHDDKPEGVDEFGNFLQLLRVTFYAPDDLISSSEISVYMTLRFSFPLPM